MCTPCIASYSRSEHNECFKFRSDKSVPPVVFTGQVSKEIGGLICEGELRGFCAHAAGTASTSARMEFVSGS